MKEKIKTNEESIRNEIINSILNMGEDFEWSFYISYIK